MTRVPTQSWLPESKVPGSLSYGVHACTRKEPLDRKAYLLYSLETYVSTHRPDEFKVARVGVLYFGLDIFLLFFLSSFASYCDLSLYLRLFLLIINRIRAELNDVVLLEPP